MAKKPIDILMDKVDWKESNYVPNDENLPYVTHEGKLEIGEITLDVCVLSTGERIITSDSLEKAFGKDFMKEL